MKDDFVRYLERNKKKSFYIVPILVGNSGDFLLRTGLSLYLEENEFKIIDNIEKADIILFHGGSHINDIYNIGIPVFKKILQKNYKNKRIVVAPHTFCFSKTDFKSILISCKQEIHLFARDEYSFKELECIKPERNVRIYLANDTAFMLQNTSYLERIRNRCKNDYALISLRADRESRLLESSILSRFLGIIFRFYDSVKLLQHNERNSYKSPPRLSKWKTFTGFVRQSYTKYMVKEFIQKNIKLPKSQPKIIIDASLKDYPTFVNLIANASEIYTDRLHVSILGAMLGKRVYLYPDKYDKIKGVYEQSLLDYPNVIKKF